MSKINTPKVYVYTHSTKGYDLPIPVPAYMLGMEQVEFHYFSTSGKLGGRGWHKNSVPQFLYEESNFIMNRYIKFNPPAGAKNFDFTIYHDANLVISSRLLAALRKILEEGICFDVAMFEHPQRSNVKDEILTCLSANKITKKQGQIIYDFLDSTNLGRKTLSDGPLYSGNVIIWSNRASQKALENLIPLIKRFPFRDQVLLPYYILKNNLKVLHLDTFIRPESAYLSFRHSQDFFSDLNEMRKMYQRIKRFERDKAL